MRNILTIPEWHGSVFLRILSGFERNEFLTSYAQTPYASAYLVAHSVTDTQGQCLFDNTDLIEISRKSTRALHRIVLRVSDLNALSRPVFETILKQLREDTERRFWFRLALALGMSVKQAQRDIDSREFSEWQAFWRLEPWGDGRGDLRAGIIASTMANLWRGANTPPFTPQDFMPQFDRPAEGEVDTDALIAQQQQLLENLTRAAGGTVY